MSLPRILLVDNNPTRIQQLEIILQFMEFQVATTTVSQLIDNPANFSNAALLLIGEELIQRSGGIDAITTLPVIVLQDASVAPSTDSSQHKPYQYLAWPVTLSELSKLIKPLLATEANSELKTPKASDLRTLPTERLQGKSPAIATVRKLVEQVASSDATVLILGESGTGKEVVARALHELSNRRHKLFVPINCGAIPAELLESELFGHEKGAFTGALTSRQGRFEMAEGGTLFLDEIGDMPMAMQVKLLRVLQERTYERVGSNKTQHCDVRIVAATHRALEHEIQENRFREDLFYRLNVFSN
nr:sigma-54-dependent Fis family transcriptional regulator [Methylocucumis oryzae]